MSTLTTDAKIARPIRVGIFDSLSEADAAVAELLAAGFTKDQITVLCSEKAVQEHYKQFEHQDPAGTNTPAAALAGSAIGAALGGGAAVVGALTLGGIAVIATGGLALWAGGVVGGLVGAMMTRGVEKELANYYNQAVEKGQILVAAEQLDPHGTATLETAAEILARHGVDPLSLREG